MFVEKIFENRDGKDKSGIGIVWLLATIGNKSTYKRIPKRDIQHIQISKVCETISSTSANVNPSLTLRLSSNLLYGVSIAYKQKTQYFYVAANNTKLSIQKSALTSIMQSSIRGNDKLNADGSQNFLPLHDVLNQDIITINPDIINANPSQHLKNHSSKVRYRRKGSKEYFLYDDEAFDVHNDLCPKFNIDILNDHSVSKGKQPSSRSNRKSSLISDEGTDDISLVSVNSFIEKANKEKIDRSKFRRSDNATIFNSLFVEANGPATFHDDLNALQEMYKFNQAELEYNESRFEEDMLHGFLNLEFDDHGDIRRSDELQEKEVEKNKAEESQLQGAPIAEFSNLPNTASPMNLENQEIDIFNFKFDDPLKQTNKLEKEINGKTNNDGLLQEVLQNVNEEDIPDKQKTLSGPHNVDLVPNKSRRLKNKIGYDEIITFSNTDLQNSKAKFFKQVEEDLVRKAESRFQKIAKEILPELSDGTFKYYPFVAKSPIAKKHLLNWQAMNNPVFSRFVKDMVQNDQYAMESIKKTEVGLNDIYSTPQQQHISLEVGRDGRKSHSRSNSGSLRENFNNFFNLLDQGSVERGRERRNSNNSDPERSNLPIDAMGHFAHGGFDFGEVTNPIAVSEDFTNPLDIDLNRAIQGDFHDFEKGRIANRNTSINQSLQDALYSKDLFVTRASLMNIKRTRKSSGSNASSRSNSSSSSVAEGFDRKKIFRNNAIDEEPLLEDSLEDALSDSPIFNKLPLNNIGKNFDELNYGSKAIMQHIYGKIEPHADSGQKENHFEDDRIAAVIITREHISDHLLPYFKSRKIFGNSMVMFNFEQLVASKFSFSEKTDKKRDFSDVDVENDTTYEENKTLKKRKKHSCSKAVASNVFSCLLQLATSSIINLELAQQNTQTFGEPCLPAEINIYANF